MSEDANYETCQSRVTGDVREVRLADPNIWEVLESKVRP